MSAFPEIKSVPLLRRRSKGIEVELEGKELLESVPNSGDVPLNLISIIGTTRHGKSYLLNKLCGVMLGEEGSTCDVFHSSNSSVPVTHGIDVAGKTWRHTSFFITNLYSPRFMFLFVFCTYHGHCSRAAERFSWEGHPG